MSFPDTFFLCAASSAHRDDAIWKYEALATSQPSGNPLQCTWNRKKAGHIKVSSFPVLPESSVGGRRPLESSPNQAPGSRLATCQFYITFCALNYGVWTPFMPYCCASFFQTNSSLKDVWNSKAFFLLPTSGFLPYSELLTLVLLGQRENYLKILCCRALTIN